MYLIDGAQGLGPTLLMGLLGGALIGAAASLLWWSHGRVAGISGVLGEWLSGGDGARGARGIRSAFLIGLLLAGALLVAIDPAVFGSGTNRPLWMIALGGVLVGYGTRLGNGCTSGHGVCGISRGLKRSIAATLAFMITGALTATVLGELLGRGATGGN